MVFHLILYYFCCTSIKQRNSVTHYNFFSLLVIVSFFSKCHESLVVEMNYELISVPQWCCVSMLEPPKSSCKHLYYEWACHLKVLFFRMCQADLSSFSIYFKRPPLHVDGFQVAGYRWLAASDGICFLHSVMTATHKNCKNNNWSHNLQTWLFIQSLIMPTRPISTMAFIMHRLYQKI